MNTLTGEILTLPKMSGSVSTPKSLSGNVGAKTINIGGKGDDGATFIPSVSVEGVISWTNDKDLPNPEPVNIKGEKGDKGDKGDRGLQGIQGERGEQGLKGDKGDRGEQGLQGVPGVKGETGEKGADGKDGYTPIKGVDYFDGINGKDGADGNGIKNAVLNGNYTLTLTFDDGTTYTTPSIRGATGANGKNGTNGKDGTSVTHSWNGSALTITSASGTSSADLRGPAGEGGAAIIDVTELPTENIQEDVFYRLLTGTFVYNQYPEIGWKCHCVEILPEVGEVVTTDMKSVTAYYNMSDGDVYGYLNDTLAEGVGAPAGWYSLSMIASAFDVGWSGVITDILDDPLDGTFRLLLEYENYSYKDDWTSHKTLGWSRGGGSEVFNHPANKAYGYVSHAEGRFTTAGVEGVETYGQHAEGWSTIASGEASHAEGRSSHAEGFASHAEGNYSHAVGRSQHVQGEYNVVDPQYNPDTPYERAKYAHIVGNGEGNSSRSNAHTLDWNGLGWFAGGLKVGGTGQDDPNAEEILTKSQVQALIDEAIARLNL